MRSIVIAIGLGSLGLFTGAAQAQEQPEPPRFKATVEKEPIQRIEPYYRAYVASGDNKFSFLVPPGFRVETAERGKVTLVNRQGNCTITFALLGPLPEGGSPLSADVYRNSLTNAHPTAKILREYAGSAGGASGPAFDLQWKVLDEFTMNHRAVYVPSTPGVLEFTLTAGRNDFTNQQAAFDLVLATFCYGTNGKLEVIHLSDKS